MAMLRHPKGWHYAPSESHGSITKKLTEKYPGIEDFQSADVNELFTFSCSNTGVISDMTFADESQREVDVSTMVNGGPAKGGQGILFFSRGSRDWASRYSDIISLAELRHRIVEQGIALTDEKKMGAFLSRMLE